MFLGTKRAMAGSQNAVLDRVSSLTEVAFTSRTSRLRFLAAVHTDTRSSKASGRRKRESFEKPPKRGKEEHVYPSKEREKARRVEHDRRASRWASRKPGAASPSELADRYFEEKWVHNQGRLSDWDPTDAQQDGTSTRSARFHPRQNPQSNAAVLDHAPNRRQGGRPQNGGRQWGSQPPPSPTGLSEDQGDTRQGFRFFATCHPGLEPVVAAELGGPSIRAQHISCGKAGVEFWGKDLDTGYRACLWLRSAIRVLVLLAEAPMDTNAPSGNFIYEWTRRAGDWADMLKKGQRFCVEAHVWSCKTLSTSLLARTRIRDAVCDAVRDARGEKLWPPDAAHPADLPLYATFYRDHVKLYRDMAGESLHRRGYRAAMHRASLNESAAAGLLTLAGWPKQQTVLADPMCGSGTFLVEAALMAKGRAPGFARPVWPFQSWPDHNRRAWGRIRSDAEEAEAATPSFEGRLLGNDMHVGSLALAMQAAETAGVADMIRFSRGNCSEWQPAATPEMVITNPPWGNRINPEGAQIHRGGSGWSAGNWAHEDASDSELIASWKDLGAFLKGRCRNAEAYVLSGNKSIGSALQMKATKRIPVGIGGIDCRLLKYDVFPPKSA